MATVIKLTNEQFKEFGFLRCCVDDAGEFNGIRSGMKLCLLRNNPDILKGSLTVLDTMIMLKCEKILSILENSLSIVYNVYLSSEISGPTDVREIETIYSDPDSVSSFVKRVGKFITYMENKYI